MREFDHGRKYNLAIAAIAIYCIFDMRANKFCYDN